MFLVGKQKSRFENYEFLTPKERATFTFRLAEKIGAFLDDAPEVTGSLRRLPHRSRNRAVTIERVHALFDLLEQAIVSLNMMPIHEDSKTGTAYVIGEFQAMGKGGVEGVYKFSRPATAEEFARWNSISTQIKRLEQIINEPHKIPNELASNEFRDMVNAMTK